MFKSLSPNTLPFRGAFFSDLGSNGSTRSWGSLGSLDPALVPKLRVPRVARLRQHLGSDDLIYPKVALVVVVQSLLVVRGLVLIALLLQGLDERGLVGVHAAVLGARAGCERDVGATEGDSESEPGCEGGENDRPGGFTGLDPRER
jgi:hypothetical protein